VSSLVKQAFSRRALPTLLAVLSMSSRGINDFEVRAIPHAELQQVLKKYNRLVETNKK